MKHKMKFSYKKQKLLTSMIVGSSLLICLMTQAHTLASIRPHQEESCLTGVFQQSMSELVSYSSSCHTIYDDTLYEDEIVVTQEGTPGTKKTTALVTYLNGRAMSKAVIDSHVLTPAIAREVHVGTQVRPDYVRPVDDYVITSYVGPRWGRSHNGIDLAVPTGTPVKSSTAGTIIQSGWNGGYGISVYVDCGNGMVIRYGHLSESYVEIGQTISQGETLGLSGNTGNSTGPHLHFEMRVNDAVVDPLLYLDLE